MMREPFLSAVPLLKKLEESGFEAYFVGGSVRDYLLNKPISDVDIATSATPKEVKTIFPKTVDVGIEHGTVLVLYHHNSYEITTFRTDGEYQDYRRPKEVAFIRNLEEDLKRRDFTMNAIAMDSGGKIYDPFNGHRAIEDNIIKTVGLAGDRFQEDALRMMRAVRFVSQLGFQIERETRAALSTFGPLLEKIAVERKRAEFEKLLMGVHWQKAITIMLEAGFNEFLPGLHNRRQQLEKLLKFNTEQLKLTEIWSLLIYCLEIPSSQIDYFLRDWRLPVKEIKDIKHIVIFLRERLQTDWSVYDLYSAGRDTVQSVERLYPVINDIKPADLEHDWIAHYDSLPIKQRTDLVITGNDVMDWLNRKPGPWLKDTLEKLENAILDGQIPNDKLTIKEWLLACSQK
jgi:tRNA nucleotidyltransferase (CCA-adding enzyme)